MSPLPHQKGHGHRANRICNQQPQLRTSFPAPLHRLHDRSQHPRSCPLTLAWPCDPVWLSFSCLLDSMRIGNVAECQMTPCVAGRSQVDDQIAATASEDRGGRKKDGTGHRTQLRMRAGCTTDMQNRRLRMVSRNASRACRANTEVANCSLTSIRVLVLQQSLISMRQRIPGDHRCTFLWAIKTLHGVNLNNEQKKNRILQ